MRSGARLAGWAICGLTLVVVATTIALVIANHDSLRGLEQLNLIEIVLPTAYAILGALVVGQQPRNALGWIFLGIAFFNAVPGPATQYTIFANITQPNAPYSPWILWIGYVAGTLVYPSGLATVALLLVPNGQLLSPRWAVVAWAGAAVTVVLLVILAIDPMTLSLNGERSIPNPTGVAGFEGINQGAPGSVLFVVGLLLLALCALSLVLRFRRA